MACLRLDIYATKQLWQINYSCISVSMQLPIMPMNNMTKVADTGNDEMSTVKNEQMPITESRGMMTTPMSETNGMAEQLRGITENSELIL